MSDIYSKEKRSEVMAAVKGRNTGPERQVRRLVHAMGFRFRLHRRDLPGSPDLVFPRFRKVVFVHGCFWHRHADCRRATLPTSNQETWKRKFERNVERDAENIRSLNAYGWTVLVIWECELRNPEKVATRIRTFLTQS